MERFAVIMVLAMVPAGALRAQCGDDWRPGPLAHGVAIGSDEAVYAATVWDPQGPPPPRLVVGGLFTSIGGLTTHGIAEWNGSEWAPLDTGMWYVADLEVFQDQLIAGGAFIQAGGVSANNIARWDGSAWHSIGGTDNTVSELELYNGDLVVGGYFASAGGVPAPSIARWDGAQWHSMGALFTADIRALASHDGALYAASWRTLPGGTQEHCIARWDGSVWSLTGNGAGPVAGAVACLRSIDGELIAGGGFSSLAGSPVQNIARWTGASWQTIGGGVNSTVTAIRKYQGMLAATGFFTEAGGGPAARVAAWTGTAWVPLSTGLAVMPPNSTVTAGRVLTEFQGELIAGGQFMNAGGEQVDHIARWNGSAWAAFAWPDPVVQAVAPLGSRLVVAGSFRQPTPSTIDARHIAAWDGVHVSELSTGVNAPVRALSSFVGPGPVADRELVVGGEFTAAGGIAVSRVARWVESPIAVPPGSWQAMGAGFNGTVYALDRFDGTTIAGGAFTASGPTATNGVARWSGTAWLPLGTGVNNTALALKAGAAAPNSAELLVGGAFTTAGGAPASRIARWVVNPLLPGSGAWSAMGAGFNGSVRAIERHQNATYAAGDFTASGATPINHVARWTGSAWTGVGAGLDGVVSDLHSSGGFLYAAGSFTTAGGLTCRRIARWDGAAWDEVRQGADGAAFAMTTFMDEVQVGGAFGQVRGSVASPAWARFLQAGQVWIAHQPHADVRPCGANFAPDVQPAQGYGGLSYQWRKDGVALVNGPTGTGSTIVGATGNIAVQNVGLADQGVYDVVITNCGGSAVSNPATLTVSAYADCNQSGSLTVADFSCFQTKFVAGDPYADCNASGTYTIADFSCFQTKFVAGCG